MYPNTPNDRWGPYIPKLPDSLNVPQAYSLPHPLTRSAEVQVVETIKQVPKPMMKQVEKQAGPTTPWFLVGKGLGV